MAVKTLPSGLPTYGTLTARPTATGSRAVYVATDDGGGTTYVDTAAGVWTQIGGSVVPSYPGPSYNIDATKFQKYRRAIGRIRSNTGRGRILFVGDSTTAGSGATAATNYPTILRDLLTSYAVPACDGAIWGYDATIADTRQAIGSGWTTPGFGGWSRGGWSSASGAAGLLSFSFAHSFDTIDVYYVTGAYGSTTVNVDGGSSLGTINSSGSLGLAKATFTCTAGVHTINFTGATGGAFNMVGVEAYSSTVGRMLISNEGGGGATSASTVFGSQAYETFPLFLTYQADLYVICLGINDAGSSVTTSTYAANMTTLINRCKTYGDVLIVSMPPSGDARVTLEAQYVTQMRALASSLGCGFLDLYGRWQGAPADYYTDGLHPSRLGYGDWAQAVFNVVTAV